MTRAEKVALIRKYVEAGYAHADIASVLGCSRKTVQHLLNDPTGAKARTRKARYGGRCEVCGAATDGSNGRAKAPKLCVTHSKRLGRNKVWTREVLISTIRAFSDEFGRPPAITDWNDFLAGQKGLHDRAERFRQRTDWPSFSTVVREFGSWSAGIQAAGFEPRPAHYPPPSHRVVN